MKDGIVSDTRIPLKNGIIVAFVTPQARCDPAKFENLQAIAKSAAPLLDLWYMDFATNISVHHLPRDNNFAEQIQE